VKQISFITGGWSIKEHDLSNNLGYFKVPQAGIETPRSKLVFKIFDEYVNILKGMYCMRFNGCPITSDDFGQTHSVPYRTIPSLIVYLQV
jgi:hypothetical protein